MAIAALVPMCRTNISQLEIGSTICRGPEHWAIRMPSDQVKNEETIDAGLPGWLEERIERYLEVNRPLICRSHTHKGFWASTKGRPATAEHSTTPSRRR